MPVEVHTVWPDAVEKRVKPEAYLRLGGMIASAFDTKGLHRPGDFEVEYKSHENYPECDLEQPHKHVIATHSDYTRAEHEQFLEEYKRMNQDACRI